VSAVAAAVAVARAHGVRCDDPELLRDAWHVLVHLRPSPVVARVTSGAPGVDPCGVTRELDVARHAYAAGAPVAAPSDLVDPGPHRHDGHTIVFWRFVEKSGKVDAAAAGRGLRAIHEALADYADELPPATRTEEVLAMLDPLERSADIELCCELAARPLPTGQAVHGDAHLFNCMPTAAGPVWHDLETACRGPREYDLAALVLRDRSEGPQAEAREALAAYGPHDAELLEHCLLSYGAWIAASFLVVAARRPETAPFLERLLQFLRGSDLVRKP
jgi:hypothetical protein